MKKILDTKYLKIALYTIFVIVVSILAYRLSSKSDNIMPYITSFIKSIFSIFEPIIYGLIIAYLMNPSMSFFERHFSRLFKPHSIKQYKAIRTLSILIVYICLFGTIILSVKFLIPQILNNLSVLGNNIPTYIDEFRLFLSTLEQEVSTTLVALPPDLIGRAFDVLDISNILNINSISAIFDKAILSTVSITGALLDGVIAFIVAIYALGQKETFVNGSKRIIYALFKPYTANKIISISEESNQLMIKFFVGK
ncbi:AI-2E family transporter, partial [Clostridium sp.]|uniref:AI-2E family transporter n=1 Tax=Clostridium sp. TaxID=1506 RepID=UPI003F3AB42E